MSTMGALVKVKQLTKSRRLILFGGVALALAVILLLFMHKDDLISVPSVPVQQVPAPVVVVAPQIHFVESNPPEGFHETFDIYEQLFFMFSADVNQDLVQVSVSPSARIKTTVYEGKKNTVVVEPVENPWRENIEYTVSISPGIIGINGEELKQKVEYKFTLKQPEVFEGGDPVRPQN